MKIKIDGHYRDVSFLGFLKGYFLSWLIFTAIFYFGAFLIGVFVA